MSLKSFDDFCAKIVNNDPIQQQKDIFDERQAVVRSQLTIRALWVFVISSGINLLIMECGPQWCESYVLSTAIFGAIAYLYWVCANARRGSLFGINGTANIASQASMWLVDGLFIPLMIITDGEHEDFFENFFIRSGMVSDYFMFALGGALLAASGIVMAVNVRSYKKKEKERAEKENDD